MKRSSTMFSGRHITQRYIRRYGETRRVRAWAGKKVHIRTEHGLWRPDAKGYTSDLTQAWVLPFEEAQRQISHCGPEKRGSFVLASGQAAIEV